MDLNNIFNADQDDEAFKRLTRFYVVYYKSMIENGMPSELASDLTEDYHWLMSCSMLFKDATHFPPRS